MAKRTVRSFPVQQDPFAAAEEWARQTGYALAQDNGNERVYSRYLKGPTGWVTVRKGAQNAEVEAWVSTKLAARIASFFILPAEIDVGKGFNAMLPRKWVRTDVNELLGRFGQPPVA